MGKIHCIHGTVVGNCRCPKDNHTTGRCNEECKETKTLSYPGWEDDFKWFQEKFKEGDLEAIIEKLQERRSNET